MGIEVVTQPLARAWVKRPLVQILVVVANIHVTPYCPAPLYSKLYKLLCICRISYSKNGGATIDLVEKSYGTRLKELESDSNSLLVISSERK